MRIKGKNNKYYHWKNKMNSFNTVKGTHDILPEKSDKWQNLEKVIHDNTSLFGYKEIRTPIIEKTDLFIRSIGKAQMLFQKKCIHGSIKMKQLYHLGQK